MNDESFWFSFPVGNFFFLAKNPQSARWSRKVEKDGKQSLEVSPQMSVEQMV